MENKSNLKNRFHDIITCPICYNKIKEHLMCPKCKKLFCKNCLKKAYENNYFCPLCKESLIFEEFISVPFMSRISNYIDNDIKHLKKHSRTRSSGNIKINSSNNQILNNNNNLINLNRNNNINIYNNNKNNINNSLIYNNNMDNNNINIFINKNQKKFDDMNNNLNKCQKHNSIFTHFCLNCIIYLCDECISIQNPDSIKHLGHKSIKAEKIKQFHLEEVINKYNILIQKKEKIINQILNTEEKMKIIKFENDLMSNCFSILNNSIKNENESKLDDLKENKNQIDDFKKEIIDNIPKINNAIVNIIKRNEKVGYKNLLNNLNDYENLLNDKNSEINLKENNNENDNILSLSSNTDIFSYKMKNVKEKYSKGLINNDNFYEKIIKNNNYNVKISFSKINLKQQINISITINDMKKNIKNLNLFIYFQNNKKNYIRIDKFTKIIENEKEIVWARLILENEFFQFINEKGEILAKFSIFYTIKNINQILE